MADISKFEQMINRARENKKPKPDLKEVYRNFVKYREQAAAPVSAKNRESEKPEKVGKPEKPKQPEEDFFK